MWAFIPDLSLVLIARWGLLNSVLWSTPSPPAPGPPSLGPLLLREERWPAGPSSPAGHLLQSLDVQPEQLALRPKEFFRAYGIEVLTEAQVTKSQAGSRPGEGLRGP